MPDLKAEYDYMFEDKDSYPLFRKEGIGNMHISVVMHDGYKPRLEVSYGGYGNESKSYYLIYLDDYHIDSKGELFNSKTDIPLKSELRDFSNVKSVHYRDFTNLRTKDRCNINDIVYLIKDMFNFTYTPSNGLVCRMNPLLRESLNMTFTKSMDQNSKQALTLHINSRRIDISRSGYICTGYFAYHRSVNFDRLLKDPDTGEIVYKIDPHYETYMPIKDYILEECGLKDSDWDTFIFDLESTIPYMLFSNVIDNVLDLLQWKPKWNS